MRRLLLLVALAACGRLEFEPRSDAARSDALVCPPGYSLDTGSCYRTSTDTRTWLDAELACEAEGAHLAVIDSVGEEVVVDRYRPSPTDFAFIGVTDQVTEGIYKTVFNRPATYLVWNQGEPNGAADDCVTLNSNYVLGDNACTNADDYICEYDGRSPVSVAWGVCPAGFAFMGTGCYHPDLNPGKSGSVLWLEAEAACEALGTGAHLVVIDDAAEATTANALAGVTDFYIGASDRAVEGMFLTVTDRPLPFPNWDTGQPAGGALANCTVLVNNGKLRTTDCANGDDFICEYDGLPAVPAAWGQ